MAIDFSGVTKLQSVGGGTIKAFWRHASSDVDVKHYSIYIRANNSDVFQNAYVWSNIPYRTGVTSAILRTESDASTYFRNNNIYYIVLCRFWITIK